MAAHVWRGSKLGIVVNNSRGVELSKWVWGFLDLFWKEDGGESERSMYLIAELWCLWIHRNGKVFRGEDVDPVRAQRQIYYVMLFGGT